jgi:hypothetical protein
MEAAEKKVNALRIPGFLSTHPAFPDRIASLQLKARVLYFVFSSIGLCVCVSRLVLLLTPFFPYPFPPSPLST